MKRIFITFFVLVLSFGVYAFQGKASEKRVPVTCGTGTVEVDDFGNASAFRIGKSSHLAPVDGNIQWVSINDSPVHRVNARNYTVEAPVEVDDSSCPSETSASSTVIRNEGDLQIDFSHTIVDSGEGFVSWFILATLTNLTEEEMSVCYYHYVDLDLFGTPDNDTSMYTFSDSDTGLPAYRPITKAGHLEIFAYRTLVPRDSWAQSLFPDLRDLIASFETCDNLPRMERIITGNITGAFHYKRIIPPGESVSVQLEAGRVE